MKNEKIPPRRGTRPQDTRLKGKTRTLETAYDDVGEYSDLLANHFLALLSALSHKSSRTAQNIDPSENGNIKELRVMC